MNCHAMSYSIKKQIDEEKKKTPELGSVGESLKKKLNRPNLRPVDPPESIKFQSSAFLLYSTTFSAGFSVARAPNLR